MNDNGIINNLNQFSKISFSDIKIKEIGSVRLINALSSIGIHSLDALISYIKNNGIEALLKVRNFGKTSLCEVYQILESFHISKENINYIGDEACINTQIDIETLPDDEEEVVYVPNIPLVNLGNNCDHIKELTLQNIHTTADLLTYCNNHSFADLYRMNAFSKDSTRKVVNLLAIMHDRNRWSELQSMIVGVRDKSLAPVPIARPIQGLFANVKEENLNEIIELIQQHYITSVQHLSIRAQNVVKSEIPYFGDAIINALLYGECYKYFRNCGRQTWEEIKLFVMKFCGEIKTIKYIPLDELRLLSALNRISYLSGKEDYFIFDFYQRNGHLPMFYILATYLTNSDNRFEKLYRSVYGIMCKSVPVREASTLYGLTYERVRQIITSPDIDNTSLIQSTNWHTYHLGDYLYLSSKSSLYRGIQVSEDLEDLSIEGFGYLCKLLYPFTHIIVKNNHYFFAQRLLDCFDIKNALTDIETTLSKKFAKDTEVPITIFVDSYWISTPTFAPTAVVEMLCEVICDNFEVNIDDNYQITIFQNTIGVSSELYEILDANGDSMNINDLFVAFKGKYPEHKYSEASQLRPYLAKDERICPIGKTSCYTLLKWDTFTGTLKDLIYNILSESGVPLTAEELCEIIRETYETSSKSIRATVVSDKSGKFILFKRGYIGINTKEYSSVYEAVKFTDRRHRQSFEDSLDEYEEFLRTHHHMPISTGTEDEKFLYRWYNNVVNKCITITPEREAAFNAMISRNNDYLVNGTEYAFYRRCDEYKVFLGENMELPSIETEAVLYRWFHNNIKIYEDFDDKRKGYFEDLISYIESYGFMVRSGT